MILVTAIQFVLIVAVIVYLTVNYLHIVRVEPVRGPLSAAPFVSICVPARNEERDIRACLDSLLKQNYPHYEVIAVDDHSSDATAEIIKSLAEKNSRLQFIPSADLPDGWMGKPHALYQAALEAKGELLLFTDADPVFLPHALTSAVDLMIRKDLDLLSLMPGSSFESFWERAVQPVVFGFIAALSRFKKINSRDSASAMGFGVFLMFRRQAYDRIGGHEAVKGDVLEDVFLAKHIKRAGMKLLVAEARSIFTIRMYHSLKEIWRGWTKNIFIAMKKSVLKTLYYILVLLGFCVTPTLVVLGNAWLGTGFFWTGLSLAGLSMVMAAGVLLCAHLRLGVWNLFLFPLGTLIMVMIMFHSMARVTIKKETQWRGRTYRIADS